MITVKNADNTSYQNDPTEKIYFELYGLSTDIKPTGKFRGEDIRNTSLFYEMDTGKALMYDEENSRWLEQ